MGASQTSGARISRAAQELFRIGRDLESVVEDCDLVSGGECMGLIIDKQIRRARNVLEVLELDPDEFFAALEARCGDRFVSECFGELRQGLSDLSQGRRI